MKFSSIIASIILCATSALGAPAATRTLPERQLQNITTTADAYSVTQTIFPSLQVRWNSNSHATESPNTPIGHLLSNPNEKVHTAVYFNLSPEQAAGKTCKLVFRLSINDAVVTPNPSTPATFDLYRLENCLNDKYSWDHRVTRGAHAGVLTAKKGAWDAKIPAAADWQRVDMAADTTLPNMGAAPTFSCQPGEYSFEMVATPGVSISWTSGHGSGLSLELCG